MLPGLLRGPPLGLPSASRASDLENLRVHLSHGCPGSPGPWGSLASAGACGLRKAPPTVHADTGAHFLQAEPRPLLSAAGTKKIKLKKKITEVGLCV